jgi:hypothetical protein
LIETHSPIAVQCPEEGGPGVFISRSILNNLGVKNGYHDEMICYSPERISYFTQPISQSEMTKIHIFPNPGTGLFYLTSFEIDFSQTNLRLTDLSGREIDFKFRMNDINYVEVVLLNASPGVYFVYVFDNLTGKSVGYSRLIQIGR